MAIYRLNDHDMEPLPVTSFEAEGILERTYLQRVLWDRPEMLEDGLFIASEELGEWEDSLRRIDQLAIDRDSRLVVIELKRDERGGAMELQAVRHAATISSITLAQVIEAHRYYLARRGIGEDTWPSESTNIWNTSTLVRRRCTPNARESFWSAGNDPKS